MNDKATATLETLKDLEGILGSFIIGPTGSIVAQDLPSYFGSAAYDIGPRAQRLQEALQMTEGDIGHCVLRYGAHKLALRPLKGGTLTIVSESSTNMPALRMAMNLVARKLESQGLDQVLSSPPPPTVRPSAAPPEAVAPTPPPLPRRSATQHASGAPEAAGAHQHKNRPVFFRGKRIQ